MYLVDFIVNILTHFVWTSGTCLLIVELQPCTIFIVLSPLRSLFRQVIPISVECFSNDLNTTFKSLDVLGILNILMSPMSFMHLLTNSAFSLPSFRIDL